MKTAESLFRIAGKVAFVTGATSGLGRHFAAVLAGHGCKVAIIGRNEKRLASVAQELRDAGAAHDHVLPIRMDVLSESSVEKSVAEAEGSLGPITILVNNAGIAVDKPALRQTSDDWHKVMGTNLTGPWLLSKAVVRQMIKNKVADGASIVNIASIAGIGPSSYMAGYAVSKAGLVHMTKVLALEWARYGVRVNAIAPGYVMTDMNRELFGPGNPIGQKIVNKIPMKRLGQEDELTGALLLLTSGAGSFMTGTILNVDGGHLVSNL